MDKYKSTEAFIKVEGGDIDEKEFKKEIVPIKMKRKPNIPAHYIPIPKNYKSSSPKTHPMLLRRRYAPRSNTPPSYKHLAAQHLFANNISQNLLHIFDTAGKKLSIDRLLEDNPLIWGRALSNEIGRLSQGINNIVGNNAMDFIPRSQIPAGKKVAYANMVCDYKPLKEEKYRVRLTIGGDKLEYLGDPSSPAASLLEAKLLVNSVISDSGTGARFMTLV